MMRYGRIVGIIVGILALCMVILFGWPAQVKAETAGMTVTAVKEKEKQESSSEESEEQEDTPDDEDDVPDDIPKDEEDDKTEDESEDKEDNEPEDEPGDKEDDEDDDMPESKEDDELDDKPEDEDENRPDDTSEDEEEDGKQRQKFYKRIFKITAIMIGLIGAGVIGAVSGLWDYLWGLLLWYLFRKRKAVWHGILTEEENRYIQIVPASEDFRLAQEIIDYSSDPMEAYGMLEETGDVTYLPKFCKVWVSFQMDGETQIQRLRCDERQVYEFMENLGDVGDKRVLIENRATGIRIMLEYP